MGKPGSINLRIDVSIEQREYSSGVIRLNETIELDALSFLEMASVLSRFHELSEEIKNKNAGIGK